MPNRVDSLEVIAARLKATRLALGYDSQNEFAKHAGISATAYNNWEQAKKRIGLEQAMKLCGTYGLSLDWIYHGDASAISSALANKLRAASARAAAS